MPKLSQIFSISETSLDLDNVNCFEGRWTSALFRSKKQDRICIRIPLSTSLGWSKINMEVQKDKEKWFWVGNINSHFFLYQIRLTRWCFVASKCNEKIIELWRKQTHVGSFHLGKQARFQSLISRCKCVTAYCLCWVALCTRASALLENLASVTNLLSDVLWFLFSSPLDTKERKLKAITSL